MRSLFTRIMPAMVLLAAIATLFAGAGPVMADPGEVSVHDVYVDGKTYDGGTAATLDFYWAWLSGVEPGDNVYLVTSGYAANFTTKHAGSGKPVTVTGLTLGGSDAYKYYLVQPTPTGTIWQRPITVTAINNSKVYDNTVTSSGTPSITSGSLVGGDSATWWQTFNNEHVATDKTLTPTGTISDGNSGNNYSVSWMPVYTGTITERAVTVTAVSSSKTYDGTTSSSGTPTLTTGSLAAGDTVTWTQTYDTRDVGTGKTLTPHGTVNDGNSGYNYDVTYATVDLGTISKRSITVSPSTCSKTYDGNTSSSCTPYISSGSLGSGDWASWSQTYDNKNAGSNKTLTPAGSVSDGNDGDNYSITFQPANVGTITQKELTVSGVTANDKVYDDTTAATLNTGSASLVGVVSGDSVSLDTGSASGTFISQHVNPGRRVTVSGLSLSGADAGNYYLTQPTLYAAITPRPLTITAVNNSKVYDGTTSSDGVPTLTSGSIAGNDTVTWSQTFNSKHVGTGKTLTPSGTVSDGNSGNNYSYTYVPVYTGVITQRAITVTSVTDTKVYDASTSSSGIPTITTGSLATGDSATWTQTFDNRHVGTVKTMFPAGTVSDGNSGNNYLVTFATVDLGTITKRPITVSAVSSSKVYDRTTSSSGSPYISSGSLAGSDWVSWSQTYDTRHVGTGKTLTPSGTVNDGNSGNNYNVTYSPNYNGTITAKQVCISGITASNKVYDGTTAATIDTSGAYVVGVIAGDSVGVNSSSASGTFSNKHVGNSKTVTITGLALSGTDAGNYTLTGSTTTTTANITQRPITVTAATDTKTYDGTTSSSGTPTITSGSLATGDSASWSQTFNSKHVGTGKTLTASGSVTDGNSGNNYDVTFVTNTTGVINARSITVTAATDTKTYDGTTSSSGSPTITSGSLATGDSASWSQTFDTKHAGTGKTLTASGSVTDSNSGNNYSVTFVTNTTGVINKRPITVTAATDTKVYDGGTSSSGTPTITSGSLATGDSVTWSQTYDTKNVGTGKTLTASGTVTDGNSGNNYNVTFVTNTTGVITKKNLTVTGITASDKVYDGYTTATINTSGAVLVGVISPDVVTLDASSAAGTFDTKHVGVGKTVQISGLTLGGGDSGNYSLTQPTTTATITKRPLAVTAINNSKVYDGNTNSSGIPVITAGSIAPGDSEAVWFQTFDTKHMGENKVLTPAGAVTDGNSGNNYDVTFITRNTGRITPRALTVTAVTDEKVYDGTTSSTAYPLITVGELVGGDTVVWSQSFDFKHVGTGKTMTPAGKVSDGNSGNNYDVTYETVDLGTITPRPITVTAVANEKVYDATTASDGVPTITSGSLATGDNDTDSWSQTFDTRHVGTEKTLTPAGAVNDGNDGNNYAVTFVPVNLGTITPKELTVTGITASNKVYDGTTGATVDTAAAVVVGVIEGDSVTLVTSSATGTFDNRNAGTGKTVQIGGLTVSGADAHNYYVTQPTTTADITPRPLSVTAVEDAKEYDGTTGSAGEPGITSGSLATGDTETNWTQTFDTKHVGTGKTLTPAGTVSDGNSGNNYSYTFVPVSTGSITQRPITVTAGADEKVYDGTTASSGTPTVTTGSLAVGDTSAWTQTYDTKHVGTGKTLTPAGVAVDGNGGANYDVTFQSADTGAITKRPVTVTAAADEKVYDGNTSSDGVPTVTSGSLGTGDTGDWSQTFDNRNVGSNKTLTPTGAVDDGNDGANYTVTFQFAATGTITPKGLNVTGASAENKEYDGTTDATVSISGASLEGIISGDTVTLGGSTTGTFEDKHVGSGKVVYVSTTGLTLGGADADNYSVATADNATADITVRLLTVTAVNNSKVYDGTTASTGVPVISGGTLATGDSTGTWTQTFDTKHVGTGKTLTPAGAVDDGNSGNNYSVTLVPVTTGTVTNRAITVTAVSSSKAYDGTTASSGVPALTAGSLAAGDSVTWTQTFDTKHIGSGKTMTPAGTVSDGNSGNNYLVTYATVDTGTISKQAITVTAVTDTKDYDGNTNSSGIPVITSGALGAGDTALWSQSFDSPDIGTGKTLTPTGSVTDGNEGNNYSITFLPVYTGRINTHEVTVTLNLKSGWNMVSAPVLIGENLVSDVFTDIVAIYTWDPDGKTYVVPTRVDAECAYWIAVLHDQNLSLVGKPVEAWTSPLAIGWNMVGSIYADSGVPVGDIDDQSGAIQTHVIYIWDAVNKSYTIATEITPGRGHWIAATSGASLVLPPAAP